MGLTDLREHAAPAVPFLLRAVARQGKDSDDAESVKQLVENYEQSSLLQIYTDENTSNYSINIRLLAIELIARSGTKDPRAIELLREEFDNLIGQQPTDTGLFSLTPGRDRLFIAEPKNPMGYLDFMGAMQIKTSVSPLEIETANSCLLAWKELTGEAPRFATDSLGDLATREWPEGSVTTNMPKVVKRAE